MKLEKNTRSVDGIIESGTVFIFFLITVLLLSNVASAGTVTYRWDTSNGVTIAPGVTTNWGTCGANPTTYKITELTSAGSSGCSSDRIGGGSKNPAVDMFFNTAYIQDTNIQGNWYFGRLRDSGWGGGTFTFKLIYVTPSGTIVVLPGSASRTIGSSSDQNYNISLTGISGTAPAGAKLGLRISTSGSSSDLRAYMGDMGGSGSVPTGYFSVTETPQGGGAQTYSLSGYVTNGTSGLPLSSATVRTNTSLTTTTNATGFYSFIGLSNGTYIINASLTGYAINSITQIVNGNSITNANISLSPVPTYLLSGYVTNASSGAAISGATVTTDTGLITSTDGAGYYSFTVSNGTYIITASETGYTDNSTTKTVNGAAVGNADISLLPVPPVLTYLLSGYVIDVYGTAISGATVATNTSLITSTDGAGYYSFTVSNGTYIIIASKTGYTDNSTTKTVSGAAVSNANITLAMVQTLQVQTSRYSLFSPWTNKASDASLSANFTSYALLLGDGLPVSGVNITFVISSPAGIKATKYNITQTNGLAGVSYDTYSDFTTSTDTDYGNWTIKAYVTSNPTMTDSTIMSIKAGGSGLSGGGCSNNYCHSTSTTSGGTPRSPYTDGYGSTTTRAAAAHKASAHNGKGCFVCHPGYAASITGLGYTGDVHKNVTCDYCHGDWTYISGTGAGQGNGIPKMPSCSDCHLRFNKNLTNISTTANLTGGNGISVYSYNFDRKAPLAAHNGTNYSLINSVPCVGCHGPAHNNTKPDPNKANTNNITEYTQCISCHSSYNRHNNSISCTVCHSQDAHAIKVFAQNATYVTGKTNAARGNCTNCHQNSTFFNILLAQPKAGNYTGRNPPQIPTPLNHSINPYAGALWNGTQPAYWDNKSQSSACNYCHGAVLHDTSALGNINQVKGANNLNQNLPGSSWCANCHYKNAPDYAGDHLSPQPPEVLNLNGLVPATSKDGTTFYNHSDALSTSSDDSTCKACHNNNLAAGATSLNFSHNVATGSAGGRDCVSCHDKGNSVEKVDVSKMNLSDSIHNFLNSNSVIVTPGLNPDNKRCWACHTNSSLGANNVVNEADLPASGHPNSYNVPKKCTQCHIQGNFSALVVSEHFSDSTEIRTKYYANTNDSCVNCHNKSEMLLPNSDPNGPKSIYASVSHYGSNKTSNASYISGSSANCSYCHQNAANAFTTEMNDAAGNSSINNHTQLGTNPACINCHNSGRIHFANLTKPTVSSILCANCHTAKDKHNGSVECSQCHMQSNRNIHPIQYLQPDGTYSTNSPANKSTAVNCTNCHQGTGVSGFDGAPKVPEPVNHSTSLSAGQKWGNYWDNTSQITACYYCHQNEIHENNTGLFGNVSVIEGSNILNNPDLANSTWCANCHYAGAQNYKGNLLAVSPPEITNSSLVASDGTVFFNHSGLTNFNDSNCKNCHGRALSGYSETSLNLSHSVSEGGGDNCIDCHGTNYIGASPSVARTFVNISAFNESIHQNLNMTPPDTVNNLDCWSCHYNKDMNRQNVKKCGDCHRKPSQWHGNANITTNLSELW